MLDETDPQVRFATKADDSSPFTVDVEKLVETRCLINANSGGGKSYVIRKMLEIAHGKVQQVVLDLEGEFYTLREKFDYLLVGKGGDISIDVRTAQLLARTILENAGTSVIIDLSELKEHERKRYVRLFLEAMVDAPRELWHPIIIVVDEAHHFCPQGEEAESEGAVKDLMTRGRKRGQCGILCTQRLSKLNKDAAAECNNVLIGRTNLDNDQNRAADILGISKERARELRDLRPGQFYAFGPAFSPGVSLVQVDPVKTTHMKVGMKVSTIPAAASDRIKAALSRFAQVNPHQAEVDLKDKQAVAEEFSRLRRELTIAKSQSGKVSPEELRSIREEAFAEGRAAAAPDYEKQIKDLRYYATRTQKELEEISRKAAAAAGLPLPEFKPMPVIARPVVSAPPPIQKVVPEAGAAPQPPQDGERTFSKPDRAILNFLVSHQDRSFSKVQIAFAVQYSVKSSAYDKALSNLRQGGLITQGQDIRIVDAAKAVGILGSEYNPSFEVSREGWLSKLELCPRKLYEVLLSDPDRVFSKQELADGSGYSVTSSAFDKGLSTLNALGLGRRVGGGMQLNPELTEI